MKWIRAALLTAAAMLLATGPAWANRMDAGHFGGIGHEHHEFAGHHGFGGHQGFGHGFVHHHGGGGVILFGPTLFLPGYAPSFDDPAYPFPPEPTVAQAPPAYVERADADGTQTTPDKFWYYCEAAGAYYPYVKTCPGGWKAIVPGSAD